MALRVDDVPRVQAVLDIVDARVETSGPSAPLITPLSIRAATFAVFIVLGQRGDDSPPRWSWR